MLSIRAWPNPAPGGTRLTWSLSRPAQARVDVFDLNGRLLRRLRDEALEPGTYSVEWDGRESAGRKAPPGVYLCRVEANGEVAVARVIRER